MKLDESVLSVLRKLTVTDRQTTMPMMDRMTYVAVNKSLELMGGRWDRSAKAHVWDCDPNEPIASAVATGEIVDWKKEFQFFETPPELAARMVGMAGIANNGERVLEPSAGKGAILQFMRSEHVVAVELNETFYTQLAHHYPEAKVYHANFLECGPGLGRFDAIVMNPPFSHGQDIQHVRYAYDFLHPGGRLVSITSPGFQFRSDNRHTEFREWFHSLTECRVEKLPEGTFKDSGTMVRALLLTIVK
jgi:predicted RNA methylase